MMAESAVSAEPDEYEENAIKDDQDNTDELCCVLISCLLETAVLPDSNAQ